MCNVRRGGIKAHAQLRQYCKPLPPYAHPEASEHLVQTFQIRNKVDIVARLTTLCVYASY
jgi:hypothetical protein